MKLAFISAVAFVCFAATLASADTIKWNWATTANASLGTNMSTYTEDGIGITASTTFGDLYYKVEGGVEVGLGIATSDDHEINAGQSIMFDLSSLLSYKVTSLTLTLGSITGSETASVCGGGQCIMFSSADAGKAVSITSVYAAMVASHSDQLTISGVTGNVLVKWIRGHYHFYSAGT